MPLQCRSNPVDSEREEVVLAASASNTNSSRRFVMHRRAATAIRLSLLAVFGGALVTIIAFPMRVDESSSLPQALERAVPLRAYLARVDRRYEPPETGPRVLANLARDPKATADDLDVALRRLAVGRATAGWYARSLANLERSDREMPPATGPVESSDELPVQRIVALGARAEAIQRVSAENSSHMPSVVRRAVRRLIATVERVAPLARALRDESLGAIGNAAPQIELPALLAALRTEHLEPSVESILQEVAARNDLSAWIDGLIDLADSVDAVRQVLLDYDRFGDGRPLTPVPDGGGIPKNLVFASECAAGLVLIGGDGDTVMPLEGVAVAIDLSGSDRWQADAAIGGLDLSDVPARIAIDIRGDDRWCGERHGTGFAAGGIVVDEDYSGSDRYESSNFGFGAAVLGAALLLDDSGDDRYVVSGDGLGFGAFGVGALVDLSGDDLYRADRDALGAGAAAGIGCLVDAAGADVYVTDLNASSRQCESTLGTACELAGVGCGLGVFVERGGDDNYRLGAASGGTSRSRGLGLFVDAGGNDLYSGADHCFGSATEESCAIFRDFSGNDDYLARAYSLGCGVAALGIFIDDRGADEVLALDPSKGVVEAGGFSIFADIGSDPSPRRGSDRAGKKR